MKNYSSIKPGLLIGTIILIISSIINPMTIGHNVSKSDNAIITGNYDSYNISEITNFIQHCNPKELNTFNNIESEKISKSEETIQRSDRPSLYSPWPMYCHDIRHTGRSPYSTADNLGQEMWRFYIEDLAVGDVVIGDDGTVFIGSTELYALYPNGTLKWKYHTGFYIEGGPAIDENGTIYFGTVYGNCYLFALYANNGSFKWKYFVGNSIFSSPAIGDDGTIYFGDANNYINALYPNGTLRWRYKTGHVVYSSPAIGDDGTVYCGSHDTYLYALHPNNGTLKWKYKTNDWIRTSPCIADDGTIYVVSLDNHLHAVKPDGTLKWKTNMGEGGTSPTIGQDGTIYCGYTKLHAVNPINGTIKWKLPIGGKIRGATPCNSIDGTIYLGNYNGSDIVAVNPDGTEKWRVSIGGDVESAPAIAKDGTVYIGDGRDDGCLYAFGIVELEADANGPYYGLINESIRFDGYSKGGYPPHSFLWDFGDGNDSDEEDPIHIYSEPGNYTVVFTVTDNTTNTSSDTSWALIKEINTPPNAPTINGPTNGKVGVTYTYWAVTTDPENDKLSYFFDWDDGTTSGWTTPYVPSGTNVSASHKWKQGTFNIKVKAKDESGYESDWSDALSITIPRNKVLYNSLFLRFLERFPLLERLLNLLIK
jgi:outer membrane protein assembly factor BamB